MAHFLYADIQGINFIEPSAVFHGAKTADCRIFCGGTSGREGTVWCTFEATTLTLVGLERMAFKVSEGASGGIIREGLGKSSNTKVRESLLMLLKLAFTELTNRECGL